MPMRTDRIDGFICLIIDRNKDNIASFVQPTNARFMLKILVNVHKIADEIDQRPCMGMLC